MLDEIKKLKGKYHNTENEKDISEIRNEMRELFKDNPDEFAESMV